MANGKHLRNLFLTTIGQEIWHASSHRESQNLAVMFKNQCVVTDITILFSAIDQSWGQFFLINSNSAPILFNSFRFHSFRRSGRGLVVRALDSDLRGRRFDPHTGRGSLLKLGQFHSPNLPQYTQSSANEYQRYLEGTCDGLVSCPGESVQLCTL